MRGFLAATARGYAFAAEHPQEAADILFAQIQDMESSASPQPKVDHRMVRQSQAMISKVWLNTCMHVKAPSCGTLYERGGMNGQVES